MLSCFSGSGFDKFVSVLRAALWIAAFSLFGVFVYYIAMFVFGEDVDVIAVTCAADALFAVLCLLVSKGDFDMGIVSVEKPKPPVGFVLAMVPVAWLVGVLSSTWVVKFCSNSTFGYRDVTSQSSSIVLVYLLSLVVAPVVEEIVCRGAAWSCIRRSCSAITAAIITSLMFAGMHLSVTHIPHTFILGLLLCVLRERGWSLFSCVCIHAIFNAFSLFVSPHLQVVDYMVEMPFVGVSFAAVVTALLSMLWFASVRTEVAE